MLGLLGFLLIALIKPYYRENRIESVNTIASTIETNLINKKATEADVYSTTKLTMSNNVCALMYNSNGKIIYSSDTLGQLCMLDKPVVIEGENITVSEDADKVIKTLDAYGTISADVESELISTDMLVFGKKITSKLANYYLVINTPLEPVESYVDFIMKQYNYIALFIVAISLLVSFVLTRKITSPIIRMNKEANRLAEGNYNIDFEQKKSYSEIDELAKSLDDATTKLGKVDELRKDLIANVSHDIKTPLTMIKAYAEMIKDISGDNPEKRNEHIDVILKEADYLASLVNDMQELSKMQAGYITLTSDNFDLKETIEDVIELLSHMIEDKQVVFSTKLEEVIVYADEIKISQVIYNFINNALKHTGPGKKIEVRMIDSEESVRVEVADEGEGIKEDLLPYIWDRYNKVDKNFARSKDSTGLGLAIAKAILESHKAKYGVTSKVGKGSTFWFELSKDYDKEYDDDERLS